ncbi:MAG: hypothetical protein KM310_03115 [Clostridiales bacterium]|nr:hypothetical protein [Clostridiales bacterium]
MANQLIPYVAAFFLFLLGLYQWQVGSFSPGKRKPTFLLRLLGITWDDWDTLTWEEKMAVYRKVSRVQMAFAALTLATLLFLFYLGFVALKERMQP